MALINCQECGREVSDQAKTCPHCGAPPTKLQVVGKSLETIGCLLTLLVTIPILLFMLGMCG